MLEHVRSILKHFKLNRYGLLVGAMMLPVFAAIHFGAYWIRFDGEFSENRWFQLGMHDGGCVSHQNLRICLLSHLPRLESLRDLLRRRQARSSRHHECMLPSIV